MSKLPRTYYAPDRYDYNGDMESAYEDRKTYLDDSQDESSVVQPFDNSEFPSTTDTCPICRDGNYCHCSHSEEYNDYYHDNDRMDDSCEYCPDCGKHGLREVYHISANHAVCACSPLYPDLRPSDYPHKPCSCDLIKYEYLGETICFCISPDLYVLLERQHKLLSDNQEQDLPF